MKRILEFIVAGIVVIIAMKFCYDEGYENGYDKGKKDCIQENFFTIKPEKIDTSKN